MLTCRKALVLFLLTALLAAPWASAASPDAGKPRLSKPEPPVHALLNRVRDYLASVWTKIGCGADPNGLCTTAPTPAEDPQPQSDIGCGADPDGHCHS